MFPHMILSCMLSNWGIGSVSFRVFCLFACAVFSCRVLSSFSHCSYHCYVVCARAVWEFGTKSTAHLFKSSILPTKSRKKSFWAKLCWQNGEQTQLDVLISTYHLGRNGPRWSVLSTSISLCSLTECGCWGRTHIKYYSQDYKHRKINRLLRLIKYWVYSKNQQPAPVQ